MADRGDRFPRLEKRLHERERLRLHSQRVRVDQASRQHQCIEFIRVCIIQREVHRNFDALLGVDHRLDLSAVRRDDGYFRTCVVESVFWPGQFQLFKSICRQDRYAFI